MLLKFLRFLRFIITYIRPFVCGPLLSRFSNNSEADASELLENHEEMFLACSYIQWRVIYQQGNACIHDMFIVFKNISRVLICYQNHTNVGRILRC